MKCHTQECEKSAVLMAHDGPGGTTPHPWCWDCAAGKGKPLPIEFERLSLAGRLGDLRDAFAKEQIPFLAVTEWGDGDLDVSCASARNAFPFLLALNAARAKGSFDDLCAWLCRSYEGQQPEGFPSKALTYLWERGNLDRGAPNVMSAVEDAANALAEHTDHTSAWRPDPSAATQAIQKLAMAIGLAKAWVASASASAPKNVRMLDLARRLCEDTLHELDTGAQAVMGRDDLEWLREALELAGGDPDRQPVRDEPDRRVAIVAERLYGMKRGGSDALFSRISQWGRDRFYAEARALLQEIDRLTSGALDEAYHKRDHALRQRGDIADAANMLLERWIAVECGAPLGVLAAPLAKVASRLDAQGLLTAKRPSTLPQEEPATQSAKDLAYEDEERNRLAGNPADVHAVCAGKIGALTTEAERLRGSIKTVRHARDALAHKLQVAKNSANEAYEERNRLVAALARMFPSGIRPTAIEGWDAEWHGCVWIDLPTGQASWHYHDSHAPLFAGLPAYDKPWDGHTTAEKYERVAKLTDPHPGRRAAARGALREALRQLEKLSSMYDETGGIRRGTCPKCRTGAIVHQFDSERCSRAPACDWTCGK